MSEYYHIRQHRYNPGDLIFIDQGHWIWMEESPSFSGRVEENEMVVFLQAYGFFQAQYNISRAKYNLKVISPKFNYPIWVIDEYTNSL